VSRWKRRPTKSGHNVSGWNGRQTLYVRTRCGCLPGHSEHTTTRFGRPTLSTRHAGTGSADASTRSLAESIGSPVVGSTGGFECHIGRAVDRVDRIASRRHCKSIRSATLHSDTGARRLGPNRVTPEQRSAIPTLGERTSPHSRNSGRPFRRSANETPVGDCIQLRSGNPPLVHPHA
jgi:hypothetical protein